MQDLHGVLCSESLTHHLQEPSHSVSQLISSSYRAEGMHVGWRGFRDTRIEVNLDRIASPALLHQDSLDSP